MNISKGDLIRVSVVVVGVNFALLIIEAILFHVGTIVIVNTDNGISFIQYADASMIVIIVVITTTNIVMTASGAYLKLAHMMQKMVEPEAK